jgi:hypothetical protein
MKIADPAPRDFVTTFLPPEADRRNDNDTISFRTFRSFGTFHTSNYRNT